MSLLGLVNYAVGLGRDIHWQLMDLRAEVFRPVPSLGRDGKISSTLEGRGQVDLAINPATVDDHKIAQAAGVQIEMPFYVARITVEGDVRANDLLVVGSTKYRVRGLVKPKTTSAIRRAYLVEES